MVPERLGTIFTEADIVLQERKLNFEAVLELMRLLVSGVLPYLREEASRRGSDSSTLTSPKGVSQLPLFQTEIRFPSPV